jgi:hypothetical protein
MAIDITSGYQSVAVTLEHSTHKSKVSSFIDIAGLAVGMAVALRLRYGSDFK